MESLKEQLASVEGEMSAKDKEVEEAMEEILENERLMDEIRYVKVIMSSSSFLCMLFVV